MGKQYEMNLSERVVAVISPNRGEKMFAERVQRERAKSGGKDDVRMAATSTATTAQARPSTAWSVGLRAAAVLRMTWICMVPRYARGAATCTLAAVLPAAAFRL